MRAPAPVMVIVMVMALLPAAVHAETSLWIVEPAPGADLADCPQRAAQAAELASAGRRQLTAGAVIHWPEGEVTIRGKAGATEDLWSLTNHCFALTMAGRPVVSGAILHPHSARLLRFPVLQLLTLKPGETLRFELTPAFPARYSPVPQARWLETLRGLADKAYASPDP